MKKNWLMSFGAQFAENHYWLACAEHNDAVTVFDGRLALRKTIAIPAFHSTVR